MKKNRSLLKALRLSLRRKAKVLFRVFILLAVLAIPVTKYLTTYYAHLIPFLIRYIVPGIVAFFLMLFVTPMTILLAQKCKITAKPEYPKHTHKPIPLLGGTAIFIVMLAVQLLYSPSSKQIWAIYAGASIIFVMGTVDDICKLSSGVRLAGQLLASAVIMSFGMLVSFIPETLLGMVFSVMVTLLWILGIINATNFSDGVDGLAAGLAGIASLFFFLIEVHLGYYHAALMASILAGCCFGFLVFNFKPAKVYLGDGGSTLLGFMLAAVALYGGWSEKGFIVALSIPVLILGVLIFDMIYITISRIKNKQVRTVKEWLDYRGRDHFHHRLINMGFGERGAVLFIFILCIILGISALVLENTLFSYPAILLIVQGALIFVVTAILMLVGRNVEKRKPK